jgi:pimeloyl-ACP methyl ester carboxylesterase
VNPIELSEAARARAIRHTIEINNRLAVYFEYPASVDNALTLIMIHGYRGNHRGLEAIAGGLPTFRILIPDLPGFGESDPLEVDHSVENYSNWLHDFISKLGVSEELHLMGHSFGTLVVGHYATKHQLRSASLVNPVSSPALEGPRASLTKLTRIYYRLASAAPGFVGQWLLRSKIAVMVMSVVMAKTTNKKLRAWIHTQHLDNFSDFASVQVAVEGYYASISTDLSKLAPRISAPVLIVAAELDDITDIDSQRKVAKTYPRAVLREISGVGHLVHYEAPDQAASFINSFLQEL